MNDNKEKKNFHDKEIHNKMKKKKLWYGGDSGGGWKKKQIENVIE